MAEKSTKAEAHYLDHVRARQCQDCDMFRPPHSCTAVAGVISPGGHCKYWEPKKKGSR